MSSITIAISSAVVTHRGERISIQAGTAWDAADPVVRAHPEMFSTDARYLRRSEPLVEQATAAPGERRGTRRSA
jgi:hypothetical protein